jgi:hypothetical protein
MQYDPTFSELEGLVKNQFPNASPLAIEETIYWFARERREAAR